MLNLPEFEAVCYGRTGDRIKTVLKTLSDVSGAVGPATEDQLSVYTRIAAAICAVLADPEVQPNQDEMASLYGLQGALTNLLRASGYRGSDHLASLRSGEFSNLISVDTALDMDVRQVRDRAGPLALLACLTALSTVPLLTAQGERRREEFLELIREGGLGQIPAKMGSLSLVTNGWMICSYALSPDKHEIKRTLNEALRDLLGRLGISAAPLPARTPLKARPTLVFAAEVIHSRHVQYRYYGQYLRQLRTRFRLVLVAPGAQVDDAVRALFDEVHAFEESPHGGHLLEILAACAREQPDILFWPSLGMSNWGPLLANLRLAPIQMVAIGHPASTFIPEIDYMVLEEGFVDDPDQFSERLILLPDAALRLERPPAYTPIAPQIRKAAEPLRVALPSSMLKMNPTYVALLNRLRDRAAKAGRRIEYHMFPSAAALQIAAFKAVNDSRLGDPVIHPRLTPAAYLERLNTCDLALSPFPFGGFHSVIDCLRQGLPVVAMDAPGNPVKTDRMLMRLLDMPDWLVATTEDAYEEAALRVILNDDLRLELGRQALAADIDARLFSDGDRPIRSEVVDAIWAVYQHHEAIQASPARALRLKELASL
jgi:hypothetical protein